MVLFTYYSPLLGRLPMQGRKMAFIPWPQKVTPIGLQNAKLARAAYVFLQGGDSYCRKSVEETHHPQITPTFQ